MCSGEIFEAAKPTPLLDALDTDTVLSTLAKGERVTCVDFSDKEDGKYPVVDSKGTAGVVSVPPIGYLGGKINKVGSTTAPQATFPTEKPMDRFYKVGLIKAAITPELTAIITASNDLNKNHPGEGMRKIVSIIRYVPESGKVSDLSTLNVAAAIKKNPVDICLKDGNQKDFCLRSYHERETIKISELAWGLSTINLDGLKDADSIRADFTKPFEKALGTSPRGYYGVHEVSLAGYALNVFLRDAENDVVVIVVNLMNGG